MLINFTKWITVALFFSVADPGFPVGWDGGVPSHGGRGAGAPTSNAGAFWQKWMQK